MTARRAVRSALVAHARASRPRESCGLLIGTRGAIHFIVPTRNLARGTSRYRVDPCAHLRVQRTLRGFAPALQVVGAYHSHPRGAARPSARDVAEANDPAWIHLIVGLAGKQARIGAFRIAHGRAERLRMRWR
ncbi:MAG TPA: M67 family metallopeptidase [Vicinamibacterales bacterium]|nr:M67 family metallopeptidase [Vicinamibacterales bacterium]